MREVCYEVFIEESTKKTMIWQVVLRFGFEDPNLIRKSVPGAYRSGYISSLPLGGVAYLKSPHTFSSEKKSRIFCSLPMPILIDLPVHINGSLHFEPRK